MTCTPRRPYILTPAPRPYPRARRANAGDGDPQRHPRQLLRWRPVRGPRGRSCRGPGHGRGRRRPDRHRRRVHPPRRGAGRRRRRVGPGHPGGHRAGPAGVGAPVGRHHQGRRRPRRGGGRRLGRQRHQRTAPRPGAGAGSPPTPAPVWSSCTCAARPRTCTATPTYVDVVAEVARELAWSVETALAAGVPRTALVIDPGIGFAKTGGAQLGDGGPARPPGACAGSTCRCWSAPLANRSCRRPSVSERQRTATPPAWPWQPWRP